LTKKFSKIFTFKPQTIQQKIAIFKVKIGRDEMLRYLAEPKTVFAEPWLKKTALNSAG
jgi:hypothetical protein